MPEILYLLPFLLYLCCLSVYHWRQYLLLHYHRMSRVSQISSVTSWSVRNPALKFHFRVCFFVLLLALTLLGSQFRFPRKQQQSTDLCAGNLLGSALRNYIGKEVNKKQGLSQGEFKLCYNYNNDPSLHESSVP